MFVIFLAVAVVIAFCICWSPFHAQRLVAIYTTEKTPTMVVTFTVLTYFSGVTYYLSATINPVLYQLLSVKFREAYKDTFSVCCKCLGGSSSVEMEFSSHREVEIRSGKAKPLSRLGPSEEVQQRIPGRM
ncbi:hypothetical protein AVEN_69545-1 [Araneus ventricosus]|uniref:G-protein coupled receptors family 1 profile domain-containing protein n=1 Tax=Araneus ventricosus TaxID=182803 RepID=A0A4Y2V0J1_ARAVE|nr:hypothetical protein AVEN_69545-1 [Araneus ventricosus]